MKKNLSLLLLSLIVASTLFSSISFALSPVSTFSDIAGTTYQDGIQYLKSNNLINGYEDGTFKPENTINRAEMIKIIVNGSLIYNDKDLSSIDSYGETSCFSDVSPDQWFTKYVCYAKAQGWVVGYENGTLYKPSQLVPFVEGLKMTLKGFDINFVEGDPWFVDAVDQASEQNYIPFTINGFYNNISRAEMSDMIARIINDKQETLTEYLGERSEFNANYNSIEAGIDFSQSVTANSYQKRIQVYFTKLENEGLSGLEIGCGNSVVPEYVYVEAKLAGDYIDDIETALNFLLSQKDTYYKGTDLYNALAQSDLVVTKVIYDELNNDIDINLDGELSIGGVCESPRIVAQLEQTVRQFGDFNDIVITINYEGLTELLDLNQ